MSLNAIVVSVGVGKGLIENLVYGMYNRDRWRVDGGSEVLFVKRALVDKKIVFEVKVVVDMFYYWKTKRRKKIMNSGKCYELYKIVEGFVEVLRKSLEKCPLDILKE